MNDDPEPDHSSRRDPRTRSAGDAAPRPDPPTPAVADPADDSAVDEAVRRAERPDAGEPGSTRRLEDDLEADDAGDDRASGEPG